MHYEENDHRNHPERWERVPRHQRPRQEGPEHFNDFRSRWNDPVPPLQSYRRDEFEEQRRQRQERNRDQHRDQYEQWYQNRYRRHDPRQHQQDPNWQQREAENRARNNQYASDRWHQDDFLLHEEELRRRYNRQFRDWEERRRR